MTSRSEKRIHKYYFDLAQPSAFTSAQAVARKSGERVEDVRAYLSEFPSHTLFKKYAHRYPRRRTIGIAPGQTIQADLADFQALRSANDGFGYCLLAVDVYSRYFFAVPVRRKTGPDMLAAIKQLFEKVRKRYGHLCTRFITDQGREFYNKECNALYKEHNIAHFSPRSEIKAAMAERGIQTFKRRLYKYMNHANSERWTSAAEPIIKAINRSVNRSTGLAPERVSSGDIDEFPQPVTETRRKGAPLSVGDTVRISKARAVFDKGYLPSWSEEIFVVEKVRDTLRPPYVTLRDLDGEEIEGIFYYQEVQKVQVPHLNKVERILDRKRVRGKEHLLIRWSGRGPEFDSWIPATDIVNL